MSRLIHEQVRLHEVAEMHDLTSAQVALHKRRAAECTGATQALKEFVDNRLPKVLDQIKEELDKDAISVETATAIRVYMTKAIAEANAMRRALNDQRLREEGAAGVLVGMHKRLDDKRTAVSAKIAAIESHAAAQESDPNLSTGGSFSGGIMAQRRAERLAEETGACEDGGSAETTVESEKSAANGRPVEPATGQSSDEGDSLGVAARTEAATGPEQGSGETVNSAAAVGSSTEVKPESNMKRLKEFARTVKAKGGGSESLGKKTGKKSQRKKAGPRKPSSVVPEPEAVSKAAQRSLAKNVHETLPGEASPVPST